MEGLFAKYTVTKNDTGEVVKNAFVLRPKKDRAARTALSIYADIVRGNGNYLLADDIEVWVFEMDRADTDTTSDIITANDPSSRR